MLQTNGTTEVDEPLTSILSHIGRRCHPL